MEVLKSNYHFVKSYCFVDATYGENPERRNYYIAHEKNENGREELPKKFYVVIYTDTQDRVTGIAVTTDVYIYYEPWIFIEDQWKSKGYHYRPWDDVHFF